MMLTSARNKQTVDSSCLVYSDNTTGLRGFFTWKFSSLNLTFWKVVRRGAGHFS